MLHLTLRPNLGCFATIIIVDSIANKEQNTPSKGVAPPATTGLVDSTATRVGPHCPTTIADLIDREHKQHNYVSMIMALFLYN